MQNTNVHFFFLIYWISISFVVIYFLQKLVDLSLGGIPLNHVQILELCKQAVEYSVKTNHPKFLNQLYHACSTATTGVDEQIPFHSFEMVPK